MCLSPGQLNIRSEELLSSCSWQSLWCVVKAGSLECFREVGDDCPVLSLLLTGMTIDNAAPSTKRELALKLLQFNKEMLCLEVSMCVLSKVGVFFLKGRVFFLKGRGVLSKG